MSFLGIVKGLRSPLKAPITFTGRFAFNIFLCKLNTQTEDAYGLEWAHCVGEQTWEGPCFYMTIPPTLADTRT
jgi:hypothetical protein